MLYWLDFYEVIIPLGLECTTTYTV